MLTLLSIESQMNRRIFPSIHSCLSLFMFALCFIFSCIFAHVHSFKYQNMRCRLSMKFSVLCVLESSVLQFIYAVITLAVWLVETNLPRYKTSSTSAFVLSKSIHSSVTVFVCLSHLCTRVCTSLFAQFADLV